MSLSNEQILVKTPYNASSGYGQDGLSIVSALHNINADVYVEPYNVGVPLPKVNALMLTKPYPRHFDTALTHMYPGGLEFSPQMPAHANKIVGWTMYEFLSFGDNEDMTNNIERRLEPFDLLLAYDEVSKQALSEYFDASRIKILQGGYNADTWLPKGDEVASRSWDDTFRFAMNGTMNQRKNPFAAIEAFKELKDEHGSNFDAELHLKTTSMVLHPAMEEWCPGLKIHYVMWDERQLKQFYLQSNCLLAPSWGEGKNLPALEAQTTGCPVMVSDFGGHKQWAMPEYSYLIPGTLADHAPRQTSFRVDQEALKEMMWHVYNNRAEAKTKGELAARTIPAMCDWSIVIDRLNFMLNEVESKPRVISK